ncbi:IgLON family member 5 [Orchesella cincta]|uniref:IgLON family member 5 n=1 Tax=Orchesella cincta TaxID=48709 RepID=A0A1D2MIA7_ORCCI|nr:IgLON family member 5 [Orchesella cincta]
MILFGTEVVVNTILSRDIFSCSRVWGYYIHSCKYYLYPCEAISGVGNSPKPPEYIFWYHNDRMINYMSSPELTVHTEPGAGKTHSRLIIRKAHLSHGGNYTCKAANADPASILVFVSQGK